MEDTKSVSVIILNYKDYNMSINCSNIVLETDVAEVIVVDNYSSDGCIDKLKKGLDKRVKLILNPNNNGYAYGNNLGAKNSKDVDYLLFMNPDVEINNDAIVKMTEFLDKHKEFAMVAPRVEEDFIQGWKVRSFKEELVAMSSILTKLTNKTRKLDISNKINIVECISGACFMIRKDVFFNIGLFDEDTFLFFEENILGVKLKNKGFKNAILNYCTYKHKHSAIIKKEISIKRNLKIKEESRKVYIFKYIKPNKIQKAIYWIWRKLMYVDKFILLAKRKLVNND